MTAQEDRLHVTFSEHAAGGLKFAFERLSCAEEVVPLADDFSMDPIDPADANQRAERERGEADYDEPTADSESVASFWGASRPGQAGLPCG